MPQSGWRRAFLITALLSRRWPISGQRTYDIQSSPWQQSSAEFRYVTIRSESRGAKRSRTQCLLPSRFVTTEGQLSLLSATNCCTYLHSADLGPFVHSVLQAMPTVRAVEVPELKEWLWQEESCAFPYTKTWEEGKSDPWLIFHTSGTTGRGTRMISLGSTSMLIRRIQDFLDRSHTQIR